MKKPTHRRHNPLHDYKSRCIYHITMVVSDRCRVFGEIVGGVAPAGEVWTDIQKAQTAAVKFTPLGRDVQVAIQQIPVHAAKKGWDVQILGACVMPEHIHFILFVRQPMEQKLGMIIRGFKQGCNKALRRYLGIAEGAAGGVDLAKVNLPDGDIRGVSRDGVVDVSRDGVVDVSRGGVVDVSRGGVVDVSHTAGLAVSPLGEAPFPKEASSGSIAPFLLTAVSDECRRQRNPRVGRRLLEEHALFEEDFDETRLRRKGQLKSMIAYVHNNPIHRYLRMKRPQWLMPVRGIVIAGRRYDVIGNVNLLALARHQVHCRYRWEREGNVKARRAHQNDCVVQARHNKVLVSPFVSPYEAAVRDFCLKEGHSVIQLHDNGFGELAQCPGGLYDYCVNGQVLVIVPSDWPHVERKGRCSRQECQVLNGYAEQICAEQ